MMRPLMVDVRRGDGDDHLSPTGLSPAFGSIGFNPSATLSTPDILSPMSASSNDRYYSSHLSGPLSAGPRTSNPFARNSIDSTMQMQSHHSSHQPRQQIRPLQPLQLRETMNRSRSDTLNSPLRSSMSWKGDSIDYTTYQGGHTSPQMAGRQPSMYPQDHMAGSSAGGLPGYDSSNYSGEPDLALSSHNVIVANLRVGNTVQSPTHMGYSNFQSPSLQPNHQRGSRMRAASASLPLGLDLRNQYRSGVGSANMQSAAHSPGPRTPTTSHIGGVSSSYTASYPSAPLTAPVDFSLPRTPGFRTSGADYSMPQMSAPIAPPTDFSQAFQASMSNNSSRTPMRDTFGGGPLSMGQNHSSGERNDDYSQDPMGLKRKRSYPGSSNTNSTPSAPYGTAT